MIDKKAAGAVTENDDARGFVQLGGSNNSSANKTSARNQAPRPRGGRRPRAKGNRKERLLVKKLQGAGLAAERIPLSGAAGGSYCGDLTVPVLGRDLVVEAKSRRDGWRELRRWLVNRDVLVVWADRSEPLVVVPLKLAIEIAMAAELNKNSARGKTSS
jgi:Holliday junction resolvase